MDTQNYNTSNNERKCFYVSITTEARNHYTGTV